MKARDLMTPEPVTCTPDMPVKEVARLMEQHDIGALPVVEAGESRKLIGVVSDRDLALRVIARGRNSDTPVRDALSEDVSSVRPDDDVENVQRIMSQRQVRRVPVVDAGGRTVGVIAQADLARAQEEVGARDVARTVERISKPTPEARS